jgi:hypothetical protein
MIRDLTKNVSYLLTQNCSKVKLALQRHLNIIFLLGTQKLEKSSTSF